MTSLRTSARPSCAAPADPGRTPRPGPIRRTRYARGGRPRRALAYYQRAADAATGVFAHAEAVRLYKEALAVIGKLPAGKDRDRQELAVLEAMAVPLNTRYGHASPELEQTAERSITLARSLGRTASMSAAMFVLWGAWFVQGRIADSHQIAGQALALADPGAEQSSLAHFAVGASSVSLGMPAAGLRHFELSAKRPVTCFRPSAFSSAWHAFAGWHTPTGYSVMTMMPWPPATARSRRPGLLIARMTWPLRWPTARSSIRCAATTPASGMPSGNCGNCGNCATGMDSPTTASGG